MSRILISGGGIAGLALAWWLERGGHEVVVIERASHFEALGHYITLKSGGVAVVREMGLLEACRASAVDLSMVQLQTASGRILHTRDFAELDATLGGFVPFRRADLHSALFDAVRDHVEIRYGEQLSAVRQSGDQIKVELISGAHESFTALVGADGIHSRTRRLVFGDGFERPMQGHYLALTASVRHHMQAGIAHVFLGRGQVVILFPAAADSVSALVYYGDDHRLPAQRDALSLRRFLLDTYADFAPEVLETFQALDADSFVFMDRVAQVRLPHIVNGRVALVGDAAHCPTFLSGMGSSLALQGARMLAQHMNGASANMPQALVRYEHDVRSLAEAYQASGARMRPYFLDRSSHVALLRNTVLRYTPKWIMRRSMQRFYQVEKSD